MVTVLRSLYALSALGFLCRGLHLQQSTTNGSLEGSGDIRPTWEQWRRESGRLEDENLENTAESARTNTAGFKECARFSRPSVDQFDVSLNYERIYEHMLIADHIYFLCVQCDHVKFPMRWRGKISMVDGLQVDDCLQQQGRHHYEKATSIHKLVLWAAKEQRLRTAMVMEEDFTLPDMQHRSQSLNHTALKVFINTGSWDILRFGHAPGSILDNDGKCKEQCLCVKEKLSADVCTTSMGCDIYSSVAYMVATRGSIVDQILEQPGTIDNEVFHTFKHSYVVPAIIHQSGKWESLEVEQVASFREHCLRD
jgi:hypothetical protein